MSRITDEREVWAVVWDVLPAAEGLLGSLTFFNDAPGRTHAEVIALLDRAIEEVAP